MLKRLFTPSRQRQPHYSFMRPGDFVWLLFLTVICLWKMWIAFTLAERFFSKWFSGALVYVVMTVLYAKLRVGRRNICADSGELVFAIMLPQIYGQAWECLYGEPSEIGWGWVGLMTLLCFCLGYQIWRAPRAAKDLEAAMANAEEEARKGTPDPSFTHTDMP